MIKGHRILLLFAFFFIFIAIHFSAQQVEIDNRIKAAMDKVDTSNIKAHIAYLAGDRLKGRLPGTEGYRMAVEYVAAQLKKMGVPPAGDSNTYIQKLTLRKSTLINSSVSATLTDNRGETDSLLFGKDFTVQPHPLAAHQQVTAGIVFAGYGIEAPELGINDYADLDVSGKIVIALRDAPDGLSSTLAAHFSNGGNKMKTATAHGAVGLLLVGTGNFPDTAGTSVHSGAVALTPDKQNAISRSYSGKEIKVAGSITPTTLHRLFNGAGKNLQASLNALKQKKSGSVPLPGTLKINFKTIHEDIESHNVVALIPGSDAVLRKEYVVHTAHLDHIGVGKAVDGDSIYNGAHDNASGVASLLEISRIYRNAGFSPKRSVLLVLLTGEEMGLLGSAYFALHPTVPKKNIVANINTDMPTVIAPLLSIVPLGAEHSSLMSDVEFAAGHLGLGIEKDPEPEQSRFVRSDQYGFVLQGIPALHIKYGSKTATPGKSLTPVVRRWREKYYHQPADEINGTFDFAAAKKYTQLNFLIGYSIAQKKKRPQWNAGAVFGKAVGTKVF